MSGSARSRRRSPPSTIARLRSIPKISRAGAFVSIDGSGGLRVERGYVRPEDELPIEPEAEPKARHAAPRPPPLGLSTTRRA
jgi:hypothetical protein